MSFFRSRGCPYDDTGSFEQKFADSEQFREIVHQEYAHADVRCEFLAPIVPTYSYESAAVSAPSVPLLEFHAAKICCGQE
jgi:hypothetical protein